MSCGVRHELVFFLEIQMRDNIEDQAGLERLGRAIVILVVAGAVGVVGVAGWELYALWSALT